MASFALSEVNGKFEIKVLDGLSVSPGIFDELKPAIETGTGSVVVDFSGVSHVNAVFLSTLRRLQKILEGQDRLLSLKELSHTMQEILQVVDFRVETEV